MILLFCERSVKLVTRLGVGGMTIVCVDGANMSLAKGSGIAVYGRNLIQALNDLRYETQVLFGPAAPRHPANFMNEVAIADAARTRVRRGALRALSTLTARFGVSAYPVVRSGMVQWPDSGPLKPASDAFWSSQDLYNLSGRAFRHYGAFVPVRFDPEASGVRPPDICHWTAPMPLRGKKTANIYTFHDLIPLRLPHSTLDDKRAFFALCKEIVRTADHIVTVSEASRYDIIRMFDASPDRISNTYQAVNLPQEVLDQNENEVSTRLSKNFSLGWKDYYLFFGAVEPKKNVLRIIQAYLASGSTRPLVIVAGRSWLADPETDLLNQMAKPESFGAGVRRLEYLPSAMLRDVVRGARGMLFPSLMEGFGLPVLEAMQLGTAVITSNSGALQEVAGEAGVRVDPTDTPAIAAAIVALDQDDGFREHLETQGRLQAAKFSPAAYKERLSMVYSKLGGA